MPYSWWLLLIAVVCIQAAPVQTPDKSQRYQHSLWPVELDTVYTILIRDGLSRPQPIFREDRTAASAPAGFHPLSASASSIVEALFRRTATCRDITSAFLSRIEAFNPPINALISLNTRALADADTIDRLLATNTPLSTYFTSPPTLLCVPLLVKDNILSEALPTSVGSLAISLNATFNAPVITRLLSSGAILLAKTNLHELALEGLTVSSAGGQTLNPWDLTRTPGGSSGGSGAALAAGMGVLALGTDTVNSLRSPASANAVLSLRGTSGLLGSEGVAPVSGTQDVVGVMAGTARDLRVGWEAVVGTEREWLRGILPGEERTMRAGVDGIMPPLAGITFGIVESFVDRTGTGETGPVAVAVNSFVDQLREAGARVRGVHDPLFNYTAISALDMQAYEFREDLNNFLADPRLQGNAVRTFEELFQRDDFLVIPERYKFVQKAHELSRADPSYKPAMRRVHQLRAALSVAWKSEDMSDIDFLIYPEQRNLVVKVGSSNQYGRNGHLGALTGNPVLAFPAGFSPASSDAPRGVPIGVEVMGKWHDDLKLLRLAERLEAVFGRRVWPELVEEMIETRDYDSVPVVLPDRTISDAYPPGRYIVESDGSQ